MLLIKLYILVGLGLATCADAYAPHYAKGLMAHVASRRDIAPALCMISSAQYEVGTWLAVYGRNTGVLRWCKVVDVSGLKDRARHIRMRRLIEIAYENVIEICGNWGRSADCPVIIFKVNDG